jgi:hypothetical protein
MTILNFFDNTLFSDHGVGIYTHPKSIQETDGEVETDGDVETVLYRGDPFWTSSHGAKSENETSDVYVSLYKADPWHNFAYIEWRTSCSDHSKDETVIPG